MEFTAALYTGKSSNGDRLMAHYYTERVLLHIEVSS